MTIFSLRGCTVRLTWLLLSGKLKTTDGAFGAFNNQQVGTQLPRESGIGGVLFPWSH